MKEKSNVKLFEEPENPVLILGELQHEAVTVQAIAKKLQHSRDKYGADLRIIRAAALRIAERAAKLLGEDK